MRPGALATAWGLLLLVACRPSSRPEALPGYEIVVPADVPERLMVGNKDGSGATEVSGPEVYAWGHRRGWADFEDRYRSGAVDPGDEAAGPVVMDEPELPARGRRDGFEACRRMVLRSRGEWGGGRSLGPPPPT